MTLYNLTETDEECEFTCTYFRGQIISTVKRNKSFRLVCLNNVIENLEV